MICPAKLVLSDVRFTNRLVVCQACHNMATLWISSDCYFVYSRVAGFGALFDARQNGILAKGEVEAMVECLMESGLPKNTLISVGLQPSLHRDVYNQLTTRERLFLQEIQIREGCE